MGGEVRWGTRRSRARDSVAGAGSDLRRRHPLEARPALSPPDGRWSGDVVAPVIRDLGITLAMRSDEDAVAGVLRAQMGKAGPPMRGKDLHTGDWAWGVLPAAAPLAIGSLSMAGMAMAFWREGSRARRLLVHRRRRLLARRVARGHQSVRGAASCRRCSACRTTRPRSRRRCPRTRPPASSPTRRPATAFPASPSTAPTPTPSPRRSPGQPIARAPGGPRADRAGVDADVRPRPSRRHALSGQGVAAVVGLSAAARLRLRQPRALRVLGHARSDCPLTRRASRPRRSSTAASSTGCSSGPSAGRGQAQRVIAGRGRARTRPASACSRTSRRARGSRCSSRHAAPSRPAAPPLPPLEPGRPFDKKGSTLLER